MSEEVMPILTFITMHFRWSSTMKIFHILGFLEAFKNTLFLKIPSAHDVSALIQRKLLERKKKSQSAKRSNLKEFQGTYNFIFLWNADKI